jgi:hypothetical protein
VFDRAAEAVVGLGIEQRLAGDQVPAAQHAVVGHHRLPVGRERPELRPVPAPVVPRLRDPPELFALHDVQQHQGIEGVDQEGAAVGGEQDRDVRVGGTHLLEPLGRFPGRRVGFDDVVALLVEPGVNHRPPVGAERELAALVGELPDPSAPDRVEAGEKL